MNFQWCSEVPGGQGNPVKLKRPPGGQPGQCMYESWMHAWPGSPRNFLAVSRPLTTNYMVVTYLSIILSWPLGTSLYHWKSMSANLSNHIPKNTNCNCSTRWPTSSPKTHTRVSRACQWVLYNRTIQQDTRNLQCIYCGLWPLNFGLFAKGQMYHRSFHVSCGCLLESSLHSGVDSGTRIDCHVTSYFIENKIYVAHFEGSQVTHEAKRMLSVAYWG